MGALAHLLGVPLPAVLPMSFRYSAYSEGTQSCSSKACFGIHLKFAFVML